MGICDGALALDGFTVGVTADRRGEEQSELMRRLGASVMVGATIRILALGNEQELRSATDSVLGNPPDLVLATTGIGMRSWIGTAESWGNDAELIEVLRRAEVWARGPKAQAALVQYGIEPAYREPSERLDAMLDVLLLRRDLSDRRIALQLYGNRVPWAIERLEAAGADVVEVPIYEWRLPEEQTPAERIVTAAIDGHLDVITFTSPPSVHNLFAVAERLGQRAALESALDHDVVVCCVGPVTAEAALAMGLPVHASPGLGRLGLMVRSLTEALRARHVHLRTRQGDEVAIQGALLMGPIGRSSLTVRERVLLRALLCRPGAFVAKPTLLREAWRHDPHAETAALDSTVARLRRQLAPFGLQITARARRGYMLDAAVVPCGSDELAGSRRREFD